MEREQVLGPLGIDQYLTFENASERRHEFVAGRVYAMSGTTTRHNAIVLNIVSALRGAAGASGCKVYAIDLKVRAAHDRVYYPDVVVTCTPHDHQTVVFDDPCFVVEVTSRSTRRIDRGEKLDAYLRILSLRGYLIAEHDRRHVTVYSRSPQGEWNREEVVGGGQMTIPCPPTPLSLGQIYEAVELPPPRVREDMNDDWGEEDAEDDWGEMIEI